MRDLVSVRLWSARRSYFLATMLVLLLAALPAGPVVAQSAPPSQVSAEYRVNAGDTLDVHVWAEERMQREVKVLPDGTFAFPLAGTIKAEGKTARDIGLEMEGKIASLFQGGTPEVTVSVKDTSGMRVYVIGKVRSPGSYSVGRTLNALQALTLAGGPSEFANIAQAVILRETSTGQTAERVDLSEVMKGARSMGAGKVPQTIPILRSGDVLVIP
ncbi:polysaccharide biosynthesis/export family protein [Sphingomonas mesophila]|uniref:polysaccharide biosynthesis/export family protein n=1 Tax=Sphingomonas mesophila TaxID=2303576 RepID=UPI0013C307C5|nr:polysaccharide biosynthesis/export family protein [Sphingomonas mesophila]